MLNDLMTLIQMSKARQANISIENIDGKIAMMLSLDVPTVDPNLDPVAAQLRAALSMPLRLEGNIVEFEGGKLSDAILRYAHTLSPIACDFGSALDAFADRARCAAEAAQRKKTKKAKASNVSDSADEDFDEDSDEQSNDTDATTSSEIDKAQYAATPECI